MIGPEFFNRSLRLHADKMGYVLSDKGLFKAANNVPGQQTKRVRASVSVQCKTEEDVFRALNLPFMPRSAVILTPPSLSFPSPPLLLTVETHISTNLLSSMSMESCYNICNNSQPPRCAFLSPLSSVKKVLDACQHKASSSGQGQMRPSSVATMEGQGLDIHSPLKRMRVESSPLTSMNFAEFCKLLEKDTAADKEVDLEVSADEKRKDDSDGNTTDSDDEKEG